MTLAKCAFVASLVLTLACGRSGPPSAQVESSPIALPTIDCAGGDSGKAVALRIGNEGGGELEWSATVTGPFAIEGDSRGIVDGGGEAFVHVKPLTAPAGTHALAEVAGSIHLKTSDPKLTDMDIVLGAVARGAELTLTPKVVAFGDVKPGEEKTLPVTMKNDGNAGVQFAWSAPSNPAFALSSASGVVNANQSATIQATFKASGSSAQGAKSSLTLTGPVCHAPTELTLSGNASDALVGVSPGALDFGLVDCGTQAAAQSVVISNAGATAFHFNALLAKGTSFDVVPEEGLVPPQGAITVTVTPRPLTPPRLTTADLFGDTLEITTSIEKNVMHAIALHETAHGADLAFVPTKVAFGRQRVDVPTSSSVILRNQGNAVAQASTTTGGGYTLPAGTLAPGDTNVAVTYSADPAFLGVVDAKTMTANVTGVICSGPPKLEVSGTAFERATKLWVGYANTCFVSATGRVYCGGVGGAGQLRGTTNSRVPVYIPGVVGSEAACSSDSCCALENGVPRCWGAPYGWNMATVPGITDAISIVGGGGFAARRQTGQVSWWGNYMLPCGCGPYQTTIPFPMIGITNAVDVSTTWASSCVARADGSAACAGRNYNGNLGSGSTQQYVATTPENVVNLTNATAIAAYDQGSCARLQDGHVACWGAGIYADPTGSTLLTAVPMVVPVIADATDVALNSTAACALRTGGGVKCWGTGVLGDGVDHPSRTMVDVTGVNDAIALGAGSGIACVLHADGRASCWGIPYNGVELPDGVNTFQPRLTPVSVFGFD